MLPGTSEIEIQSLPFLCSCIDSPGALKVSAMLPRLMESCCCLGATIKSVDPIQGCAGHRGSIHGSHTTASGLNLGTPDFLTIEISRIFRKCCLDRDGIQTQYVRLSVPLKRQLLSGLRFPIPELGWRGKALLNAPSSLSYPGSRAWRYVDGNYSVPIVHPFS